MAATVRSLKQRLLRRGTTAGPVTQEMIDRCEELNKKYNPKDKWGWTDFLPEVRKEFAEKRSVNATP